MSNTVLQNLLKHMQAGYLPCSRFIGGPAAGVAPTLCRKLGRSVESGPTCSDLGQLSAHLVVEPSIGVLIKATRGLCPAL